MAYENEQDYIDQRIEESQKIGNSWRDLRKHGLYFLNQNIAKYGVERDITDFSRKHKSLWIMGPLLILVLINAAIMMFSHSIIIAIPSVLASIWIYQLIIRKFVLDENLYKRLIAENELAKNVSLEENNNLLSIDPETGQWFFQNSDEGLRTGFLITFDYASILDLSLKSNDHAIDDAFVPFFKQLHENKFSFFYYDLAITDTISYGTLRSIENAKLLEKGSWLQLIETLQNETMSSLEQNSDSKYRQFYLVYNDDFQTVTQTRSLLDGIISSTLGTQVSIVNPHICGEKEIIDFICNYYAISSFSLNDIVRNVQRMDISKFFKFVSFIDTNGTRYSLEDITDLDNSNGTFADDNFLKENSSARIKKEESLKKQKKLQEEKEKRIKLNKIIAQQKQFKNEQLQKQKQNSKPSKAKNNQSNSNKPKAGSLGISRNVNLEKRRLEKERIKQNKANIARKEQLQKEKIAKKEQLRNHELDFNDKTSINDLLNLTDKK